MQVSYELTQKDILESLLAHRTRTKFLKWLLRICTSILILSISMGLIGFAVIPRLRTFVPLVLLFALYLVLLWYAPRWSARRQFTQQPAAQGSRTMSLDSAGVQFTWNGGDSKLAWNNFIRWIESKNQFILYTSPVGFVMIPKRGFSPEQIAEFRSALIDNVSSK
jgi:hypothetical protein